MEKMIGKEVETTAIKYELMSDGIVAEIEDKLFVIFTYGPESRYYCKRSSKIHIFSPQSAHFYGSALASN